MGELDTLTGGRDVLAHYQDGTKEPVRIHQISIRQMDKYLATIDDEPARLELVTGNPAGWADKLTLDSHAALIEIAEEINANSFFGWLRRRIARQEKLAPGSSGELGKSVLQSASGSPKSA